MEPTTITTIVLILFALVVFALTAYAWLGAWNLMVPKVSPARSDDQIEAAVVQMRRAIEDYERSQR